MHLGDRARARRPAGAAARPDHGDMTTANAESGQIRPANKPGRGRLQHTAFVVAMGAQPIGLLEVDARLRWRGVRWLSRIPRGRGAEGHRAHRRGRDQFVPTSGVVQRHTDTQLRPKSTARWLGQPFKGLSRELPAQLGLFQSGFALRLVVGAS